MQLIQAEQLERCSPLEFAAAVNLALSKGGVPKSPLGSLVDTLKPALGPTLGSYLNSSAAPFLAPPIVETAVGPPAKSFPLHLVHSGRWV